MCNRLAVLQNAKGNTDDTLILEGSLFIWNVYADRLCSALRERQDLLLLNAAKIICPLGLTKGTCNAITLCNAVTTTAAGVSAVSVLYYLMRHE